eukprot:TRINITY_DN3336_c0_g3_i1.p1 TRINITY_DN3336_c0_g3~~TRINITY_DN3336_c0_g3_i1.p1  ORF type:complete len:128 (+),score=18.84 TRINITY_DN3336_c0_g3_i1:60-443(+)
MIKLALLITALVVCGTRADLPVHCLKRNIVGRWTFDLGPPVREDIKSGRSCGHPIPDTKLGSFRSIEVPFGGERAGFKYWIILNTWGTGFGDQGYFLVRRGKNDFGIESMPEAAIPYIIGPDGRRLR